jgi:hypothetical protein
MDELVASAVAHWGPRFRTNGVTTADFARITAGIERWDDWCRTWTGEGAAHEALGRDALAEGRTRSAGEHLARVAVYHHFAKFVFVTDLDQMRAAHERAVACLTDALPHPDPPGRRLEIPFEGSRLVAVVRTPRGAGPHPVVLMLPGLDSTKEELGSTEQTFLDRGMATVTLDGAGQGEAEYDLPVRGDWAPVAEVVWDAIGNQPDLDRSRLAVWGFSLGGYYAPRVPAALGDRVSACVSLAGPFNFGEYWSGLPPLTRDTHPPGPLGVVRRRAGAPQGARARPVAGGVRPGRPAADRLRSAGPADPVGERHPDARRRRRSGHCLDARGRQPRLRQRLTAAPPDHCRLGGRPAAGRPRTTRDR